MPVAPRSRNARPNPKCSRLAPIRNRNEFGSQLEPWPRCAESFVENAPERRCSERARPEEPWLCPVASREPESSRSFDGRSGAPLQRGRPSFDYLPLPGRRPCSAPAPRQVPGATGLDVAAWPQSVLRDGPLRQPWLEWRRANITAVVKGVSAQARAVRPGIKISAAVFPNWTADRDGIGQDWKLWCEKGYVDFVCPMDYTDSNTRFGNMVADQVRWAGRVPCYPGIGLSASSPRFGVDRVIEQITIARQHKTGGFVISNDACRRAPKSPPAGLGITKKAIGADATLAPGAGYGSSPCPGIGVDSSARNTPSKQNGIAPPRNRTDIWWKLTFAAPGRPGSYGDILPPGRVCRK